MVKGRYFRDSCYRTPEGLYIKDLRVLGKPLENVILIDNVNYWFIKAAYSYAFQLDNGVPIIPFYDDKTDMELKKLTAYLKPLSSCKDIRKHNCRFFKTRHYVNYADPLALISSLYHNPTEQWYLCHLAILLNRLTTVANSIKTMADSIDSRWLECYCKIQNLNKLIPQAELLV